MKWEGNSWFVRSMAIKQSKAIPENLQTNKREIPDGEDSKTHSRQMATIKRKAAMIHMVSYWVNILTCESSYYHMYTKIIVDIYSKEHFLLKSKQNANSTPAGSILENGSMQHVKTFLHLFLLEMPCLPFELIASLLIMLY